MSVHDLWKGLPKEEVARRRKAGAVRWQRRWHGPDRNAAGRLVQHKVSYPDSQKPQADLDDATQRNDPRAHALRLSSITVNTLMDRHLGAKRARAPKTVEADEYHASVVRESFGDRVVSTLDTTEVETWSQRDAVAASSRKKQLEILRAAIKRGVRDQLIEKDVTEGLVVKLTHAERPHWSSAELRAIIAASSDFDACLFRIMGFMGLREKEARLLRVDDVRGGRVIVRDSKTGAGLRTLPIPPSLRPSIDAFSAGRRNADWLFASSRKAGLPIAKGYANQVFRRRFG